ncbi:MAG: hypothetical protein QM768_11555 [Agriterribacter sp.]
MIAISIRNNIECISLKNDLLSVIIVPAMGGKILSIFNDQLQKEFLWHNNKVPFQAYTPGADYDANFLGAIDELIPNDIPEIIDGIEYPDHGELWTTALQYKINGDAVTVYGYLPLSGLFYSKTISLKENSSLVKLDYQIVNQTNNTRHFLWKLHAALAIEQGDTLVTPAKTAKVVDAAYSRFEKQSDPFEWPFIGETNAAIVPKKNNTMDFFYLYSTGEGFMQMESAKDKTIFSYQYDTKVFPYQWYFASYGGFLNHYTAILEPCTTMPISVKDAIGQKQTAVLQPGEKIETSVTIYAGIKNEIQGYERT